MITKCCGLSLVTVLTTSKGHTCFCFDCAFVIYLMVKYNLYTQPLHILGCKVTY